MISRGGGFIKMQIGEPGDQFVELVTNDELLDRIKEMGPEAVRRFQEALNGAAETISSNDLDSPQS